MEGAWIFSGTTQLHVHVHVATVSGFLEYFFEYPAIFQMELVSELNTRTNHVKSISQYKTTTSGQVEHASHVTNFMLSLDAFYSQLTLTADMFFSSPSTKQANL